MNDAGKVQVVDPQGLADIVRIAANKSGLRGIVMNACNSEIQAQYMANALGHVVSMRGPVGDQAAINFSRELYGALGDGLSFRDAFETACAGARAYGPDAGRLEPRLIERNEVLLPLLEMGFSRAVGEEALQKSVNRDVEEPVKERVEAAVRWLEEHQSELDTTSSNEYESNEHE